MSRINRRHVVGSLLGGAVLPVVGCSGQKTYSGTARFDHGVASGDPLSDRVILWTRVSGIAAGSIDVDWAVATDPSLRRVIRRGRTRTGPERDFTVKVDADGLPSGARLYYRFAVDNSASSIGQTRTLANGPLDTAKFAVVSCANHPYGYFHVYREIAQRGDLDAVLHLGDYIYEYGMGEYATERAEALGRVPVPEHRLVTLQDYRQRHAQYKADADLQALHATHPMIAVWDDHELANDAWRDGAQNHVDGDGSWAVRRDTAIQAWLEWMPVRVSHAGDATRIYRRYQYGDLVSLIMLDTRLLGRDRQPDVGDNVTADSVREALGDDSRRLLGDGQERWLRDALDASGDSVWQLIGQQVMVSPTLSPELGPLLDLDRESLLPRETLEGYIQQSRGNPPMLLDTWNGYPIAREDFLRDLEAHARNPVVLSGDLHTSLAGDLMRNGASRPVAVEFMTGSVTSPGFAEYLPETHPGAVRDATLALNPSLRYMETDRRGWLELTLDRAACTGEWHLVSTVHDVDFSSSVDATLYVEADRMDEGLQSPDT